MHHLIFFVRLISWRFAQIQPPDGDCDLYMCRCAFQHNNTYTNDDVGYKIIVPNPSFTSSGESGPSDIKLLNIVCILLY